MGHFRVKLFFPRLHYHRSTTVSDNVSLTLKYVLCSNEKENKSVAANYLRHIFFFAALDANMFIGLLDKRKLKERPLPNPEKGK